MSKSESLSGIPCWPDMPRAGEFWLDEAVGYARKFVDELVGRLPSVFGSIVLDARDVVAALEQHPTLTDIERLRELVREAERRRPCSQWGSELLEARIIAEALRVGKMSDNTPSESGLYWIEDDEIVRGSKWTIGYFEADGHRPTLILFTPDDYRPCWHYVRDDAGRWVTDDRFGDESWSECVPLQWIKLTEPTTNG
jgi:hypothetical protein